jgi:flagellar protein FliO/FliZ
MKSKTFICITALIIPITALSAQVDSTVTTPSLPVSPVNMSSIFQVIAALLVIVLMIFAISWVYKKYAFMNGMAGDNIKVLSAISLGGKEKAVLLKVGSDQIVLGVSPGYVRKVHTLTEPVTVNENNVSGSFISKLTNEINKAVNK